MTREEAFRKNFQVVSFAQAVTALINRNELWSCRYAEDTLEDEDGQPSFTTISYDDVCEYTLPELEKLGPFAL